MRYQSPWPLWSVWLAPGETWRCGKLWGPATSCIYWEQFVHIPPKSKWKIIDSKVPTGMGYCIWSFPRDLDRCPTRWMLLMKLSHYYHGPPAGLLAKKKSTSKTLAFFKLAKMWGWLPWSYFTVISSKSIGKLHVAHIDWCKLYFREILWFKGWFFVPLE